MDRDTIELCWTVLKQYIKSSDLQHAADHLFSEIVDAGIDDAELPRLAAVDAYLKSAAAEYADLDEDDEDQWEN